MFKIALMVYKCINNMAPIYLKELIHLRNPKPNFVRLDNDFFFLESPPKPSLVSTERAFSHTGPKVWNDLPYCIRSSENITVFKTKLKTYYYNEVYSESAPTFPLVGA